MVSTIRAAYDTSYMPPAPVIDVEVTNPMEPSLTQTKGALLDVGSDITIVPQTLAESIGLVAFGEAEIAGYDGAPVRRELYRVHLKIGALEFPFLEIAAAPIDEFILGRDVLNNLVLLLDGPRLFAEILNA